MTQPAATCPNCGAKIVFKWSSSVQTTCEYCKSILVRTDVDLTKVGQVADLPPDNSPIQLNTEGIYKNRAFVVIGRILYEYEQGGWNEWHLMMNDGGSGWLSDAQQEYAVSFAVSGQNVPPLSQLQVGQQFSWGGQPYTMSVITTAHYRGVQGELPFQLWDKTNVTFADFRTETGKFATLDYSDKEPALYLGEYVEFEDLKLKNLRQFEGW
jgi:DNA-directed RNA polymerase subunit RPC12/RpoP